MPPVPALRRLRLEDFQEFQGYRVRYCLKEKEKRKEGGKGDISDFL